MLWYQFKNFEQRAFTRRITRAVSSLSISLRPLQRDNAATNARKERIFRKHALHASNDTSSSAQPSQPWS